MSYNLYVTRKKFWVDNDLHKTIPHKLFIDYVEKHPKNVTFYLNDKYKNDAIFMIDESGDEWHLKYEDGNIRAAMRQVPREVFIWMLDFAKALNADIQGEDGESYLGADPNTFKTIADMKTEYETSVQAEQAKRASKKRNTTIKRVVITAILLCSVIGWVALPFLWYSWLKQPSTRTR